MKLLRIYVLLFFVGLGLSCAKKKYPESVVLNHAIYYTSFNVNGVQNVFQAGVNNYYIYSDIVQDSNLVYNFMATFRKVDCQTCPLALSIQINDYKTSALNAPVTTDSSLMIKPYVYLPQNASPGYSVNFTSSYTRNDPGATYFWSFGDGQTSNVKDPVHNYNTAGTYQVCLSIKGSNFCASSMCTKIRVSSSGFNTSISTFNFTGNTMTFSHSTIGGFAPYNFLWNFGDGQTSIAQNPSHNYLIQGAYPVSLRIIDSHGDTAIANYNAVTKTDLSSCAANIGASVISLLPGSQFEHSKIKISFTDENGVVFQSNAIAQPSGSVFEILSVEPGDRNEKGELTKKLHVKFNCKLGNGSKIKTIDGGDAVICVAYK
ncbi:MAG: PKD domain-containing protein [bacterium]|nr:PKD domain-containing protein [bacterium]